jgi:hypothetical protein
LLEELPGEQGSGRWLADALRQRIEPPRRNSADDSAPEPLTYHRTARRSFETAYWKTIARLATDEFLTKESADCPRDAISRSLLPRRRRDLDRLADYLLSYYRRIVEKAGMASEALTGELPFSWHTDFAFDWSDSWVKNQDRELHERNLLVMVPGRDRRRAVIMADHYDTAYMEDVYARHSGARLAAHGADDNHSATAALMLAAPVFLELSRQGRLGCDVWLVHLTGEEFPADCLGSRHLVQRLVGGTLKLDCGEGKTRSLHAAIKGVYVLDMVAHDRHDQKVFQISPGMAPQSLWLAWQAHVANMLWNESVRQWNRRQERRRAGPGRRSADPAMAPPIARHPRLYGEVRPATDPRSTLFNTDGQVFSDAGVPVVLFMENYDINRHGYHDTKDTMANIDLDYGAGVAAIAIEAVARAACVERWRFLAARRGTEGNRSRSHQVADPQTEDDADRGQRLAGMDL